MIPFFLMIAAILVARAAGALGLDATATWHGAAAAGLAVMFVFTGIAHFNRMRADLIRMVPPVLPRPGLLVTLTGLAEIAGAVGLLVPGWTSRAAIGLAVLLVALFPANVYAVRSGARLGGSAATPLMLRAPMQLIWIALLLWVAFPAAPGGRSAGPVVDAVALRSLLEAERTAAGAPGAVVGVQLGGGPVTVVAAGHLDLDGARTMPDGQSYYLGSVSKTYTAAVVMRLAELGRLSLDDTIDRWFPEFPRARETTVRQLLDHTNGLKDVYSYMYFRPDRAEMIRMVTRSWSETEVLGLAGRLGHWFDPGTDWAYSSTGYYLLGVIAERASGRSLPEALAEYVYEPLGLGQTWLAGHEPPRAELPEGFMGPVEGWPHSDMFGALGSTAVLDESPVERGAGGLVAPAADAARFMSGLLRGELLEPASLEEMRRFRDTPPLGYERDEARHASENGYGLGLIRQVRRGLTFIGHGGLFTGHTAGSWYVPQCDATVAFYMNRGFVGQGALLEAVATFLVDAGHCPGQGAGAGASAH